MTTNELNQRADRYLAERVGMVEIVSYGSLIQGRRHGNCPCCRWHQFMSDYERAAEISFSYKSEKFPGLTYSVIVCERCARRAIEIGGVR